MSVSTPRSAIAEMIASFTDAPPDRLNAEYQRLVGALWSDGVLTDLALPAIPVLVDQLDRVDDDRRGRLAILLGLLAEAEHPHADGEVSAAVGAGLDRYLNLLTRSVQNQPLTLALLYLIAHLPDSRERILSVTEDLPLAPDDRSRLDRALRRLDPENPDLGRVWPSPSVWTLNEAEQEFDQGWIKKLTPEQTVASWQKDTETVLGCSGAKAYWAVCNGAPQAVTTAVVPPRDPARTVPSDSGLTIFSPHLDAFRCPTCHSGLRFEQNGVRCADCSTRYPIVNGILDLSATIPGTAESSTGDLLQKLSEMPSMGLFYEAVARPAFLRVSGSNWGGEVTPADEDRYIAEHVRPVAGPVLDLAAGAGRWTAVLAEAVGADRVIALDTAPPMLTVLREKLPEVPSVLASASLLPFDDATLGAVNCWNALQAFPDDAAAAIAEVGRCLRPGGTFTLMTFRWASDPIYRHFQASHHFPQHPDGLRLFELDELRGWLTAAGMTVREESGPGTFVFITAERTA